MVLEIHSIYVSWVLLQLPDKNTRKKQSKLNLLNDKHKSFKIAAPRSSMDPQSVIPQQKNGTLVGFVTQNPFSPLSSLLDTNI